MILTPLFREVLIEFPFARRSALNLNGLEQSEHFVFAENKEVPAIARLNTRITSTENIPFTEHPQFQYRLLSKDKMKELLSTAPVLIKIAYLKKEYFIGKGMLFSFENSIRKLLFLVLVPNKPVFEDLSEARIIIHRDLLKADNKILYALLSDFILEAEGDVLYTTNLEKYVGQPVITRSFSSIREKRDYVHLLVDKSLTSIKNKIGVVIPTPAW